ncbi:protein ALP1-like [Camponotus floridanus]|uniref:protein ALP1-like n=1 Tax=Camponotus floridanus TaxID=104421 RepID=UPI000DC6B13A|nr:protein ALP1-like [Camponotus floridanus]
MTVNQFEKLLDIFKHRLIKISPRKPLSPEFRLVMTLYYLAHGPSMQVVAWSFCVSKSTVSNVIRETCAVIWDELSPIYLKPPTTEEWEIKATEFWYRWNLPNCFGAMDGKHITIQAPKKSGSQYFNYKKTFSIVLMAVCDAFYLFTLVDVGAFGSQSDGGIFKESAFGKAMDNNELGLPGSTNLRGTNIAFPYFVAADEAFPLKHYIMRPYPGTNLSEKQQIFNYRLSRARRVIENTFGILASRWRILHTNIIASVSTIERIVCATLCLHNFVKIEELSSKQRYYCPDNYVDRYDDSGCVILGDWRVNCPQIDELGRTGTNRSTRADIDLRNTLADYLVSPEGKVDWQYNYVKRGSF